MKILLYSFLILVICGFRNDVSQMHKPPKIFLLGAHNCDDPSYFPLVKEYIISTGDSITLDVSGRENGGMMLTYYFIKDGNWKLTVDHTNRIYFSVNEVQFGNILKEINVSTQKETIVVEYNYLGTDKTIVQAEVEEAIREKYCDLIDRAYLFLRSK